MAFLIDASFPGLSGVAGVAGAATRITKVPFAVQLGAPRCFGPPTAATAHLPFCIEWRGPGPVIFAASAQMAALSPTTDKIAQSVQEVSVALRDLSATGDKPSCAMPAWLASLHVDNRHLLDLWIKTKLARLSHCPA